MSFVLVSKTSVAACVDYSMDAIRSLIERCGPRPPGSEGERQCQEWFRDEFEALGVRTAIETFPVAQKAFMAMPLVCSLLALCSLPLYWHVPRLAPIPVLVAVLVCVCELVFYRHVLTPFFPKSTSRNVWAAIPPSGEVRRRLILGGHADAAYEWRFQYLASRFFPFVTGFILLSFVYVLLSSIAIAVLGGSAEAPLWRWLGLFQAPALVGLCCGLLYTNFKVTAPGAADNLTGSLTVLALARLLKMDEVALKHTELVLLVTGAEEAGLEGARAFLKAHQQDWQDVETCCIALDTLCERAHLAIYNRDLNGRVPHDPRVCTLIHNAGETLGLDLPETIVPLGASDAAAFSQAGVPAAALCAMDHAPAHYYHNRRDSWEIVERDCMQVTLELAAAICDGYDRNGLSRGA